MYVCLCNAVTERRIRELVAAGYRSLDEIQLLTGCADTCGSCYDHAEAVIASALAAPALPVMSIETHSGQLHSPALS